MTLSERDKALYDVVFMLREYRSTKPRPRKHGEGLTPRQLAHWSYLCGCETGERSALYSAILRVESLLSDRSLIEDDPP